MFSDAEKLTSRFWVLNRKSNGSFQVSFLFKTLSKNREVIFCVRLRKRILIFRQHTTIINLIPNDSRSSTQSQTPTLEPNHLRMGGSFFAFPCRICSRFALFPILWCTPSPQPIVNGNFSRRRPHHGAIPQPVVTSTSRVYHLHWSGRF